MTGGAFLYYTFVAGSLIFWERSEIRKYAEVLYMCEAMLQCCPEVECSIEKALEVLDG